MALTNYQSFAAPAGQGFITDEDGNRRYYDVATGQWLTPRTGGGIDRPIDLEMLSDGGFMRQGGTSDFYRSLGILGQADGLLEVDINQNPDFAPYVQNIDGKNFVTSEVWHQLRPQNSGGLGDLLTYAPVIAGLAGGLGAAGGFFDPYSLVAAESATPSLASALGIPAEYGAGLETAYGSMTPAAGGAAGAGAGAATTGALSAADVAGLTQMGIDAGLSGPALDAFVTSGGTLGSTAAGGLGGATTLAESFGLPTPEYIPPTYGLPQMPPTPPSVPGSSAPPMPAPTPVPPAPPFPTEGGGDFWKWLNGQITDPNNYGNVLKGLLGGGLGYLSADRTSDALERVANQNLAIGAPFRDRLNQSYAPGFDLMAQPGYGDAFNRMAEISTRQWSPRGNPANSPGISAGILSDVWNQSYLPALSNFRGQLGQFGGLGLNTAGNAQLMGAANAGDGLDEIAKGLGYALTPQTDRGSFGGPVNQNPLAINVGGVIYRRS